MKRSLLLPFFLWVILLNPITIFSQSAGLTREVGLTVGAFTNFPMNQNYLKDNIKGLPSLTPYVRVGRHEFFAGLILPSYTSIYDLHLNPCLSATAGYRYYVFNPAGRENLYINYSFQYLWFKKNYDAYAYPSAVPYHVHLTEAYINNILSLGYVVFLDRNQRFGFYYSLGYIISQIGDKSVWEGQSSSVWYTHYIWNRLSTQVGFSFKLKSFDKK
jgi:hypothetical protein